MAKRYLLIGALCCCLLGAVFTHGALNNDPTLWSYNMPGGIPIPGPTITEDGTLFTLVADDKNHHTWVQAIEIWNGRLMWSTWLAWTDAIGEYSLIAAIGDGKVFVPFNGVIIAVNKSTGKYLWSGPTGSLPFTKDTTSPSLQGWHYAKSGTMSGGENGTLYFSGWLSSAAFSGSDGSRIYNTPTTLRGSQLPSQPSAIPETQFSPANGLVVESSRNGTLVGRNFAAFGSLAGNGSVAWVYYPPADLGPVLDMTLHEADGLLFQLLAPADNTTMTNASFIIVNVTTGAQVTVSTLFPLPSSAQANFSGSVVTGGSTRTFAVTLSFDNGNIEVWNVQVELGASNSATVESVTRNENVPGQLAQINQVVVDPFEQSIILVSETGISASSLFVEGQQLWTQSFRHRLQFPYLYNNPQFLPRMQLLKSNGGSFLIVPTLFQITCIQLEPPTRRTKLPKAARPANGAFGVPLLWSRPTSGYIYDDMVADGSIFLGEDAQTPDRTLPGYYNYLGLLQSIDVATGAIGLGQHIGYMRHSHRYGKKKPSILAAGDGKIFTVTNSEGVAAIQVADGTVLWKSPQVTEYKGYPSGALMMYQTLDSGRLSVSPGSLFATGSENVYQFNGTNGTEISSFFPGNSGLGASRLAAVAFTGYSLVTMYADYGKNYMPKCRLLGYDLTSGSGDTIWNYTYNNPHLGYGGRCTTEYLYEYENVVFAALSPYTMRGYSRYGTTAYLVAFCSAGLNGIWGSPVKYFPLATAPAIWRSTREKSILGVMPANWTKNEAPALIVTFQHGTSTWLVHTNLTGNNAPTGDATILVDFDNQEFLFATLHVEKREVIILFNTGQICGYSAYQPDTRTWCISADIPWYQIQNGVFSSNHVTKMKVVDGVLVFFGYTAVMAVPLPSE